MKKDLSFILNRPIAHRGLHSGDIPENSMPAFRAAIQEGYPIETDVRILSDGSLILFHDDDLNRLCGKEGRIYACTKEQVDTFTLLGTEEKIPTFKEFLNEVNGQVPLLVEIKTVPEVDSKKFIRAVLDELKDYKGEVALQSFQPKYGKILKKMKSKYPFGILATASAVKENFSGPFWRLKAFAVRRMVFNKVVKPDFISYQFSDYPNPSTDAFKKAKLAWTVRSPEDEEYARKYADNIIFENYIPSSENQ